MKLLILTIAIAALTGIGGWYLSEARFATCVTTMAGEAQVDGFVEGTISISNVQDCKSWPAPSAAESPH